MLFGQVEWLRARISAIPVRLVFESALELMGTTQIGTFQASHLKTCPASFLRPNIHLSSIGFFQPDSLGSPLKAHLLAEAHEGCGRLLKVSCSWQNANSSLKGCCCNVDGRHNALPSCTPLYVFLTAGPLRGPRAVHACHRSICAHLF